MIGIMKKNEQKKIKTIIFDMDGVIFDTENMFLRCWQKVALDFGLTGMEDVYRRVIGVNAEATKAIYLDFYGEDFAYDELCGLAADLFYERYHATGLPVKAGAVELLDFLTKNDYQIGLASSTNTRTVKKHLGEAGLLAYFKVIVGGDMVEKSKPEPDIFREAFALLNASLQLQISPSDVYVIEDSFNGVRAAHSAGMNVLMVPDIAKPDEEMQRLATRIFANLLEVKDFLSKFPFFS